MSTRILLDHEWLREALAVAARNVNGRAILYADVITGSMCRALDETSRRRILQTAYNDANGITPQTILKPIDAVLVAIAESDYVTVPLDEHEQEDDLTPGQRVQLIDELETRMKQAGRP